jgi:ParB/RepB/Spo0J family partition protein
MTTPTEIRWLRREQILIGESQPRKHFDQTGIGELVESFKQHGFSAGVSHLLVRPLGEYQIKHAEDSNLYFIQRRMDRDWETVATAESDAEAKAKQLDAELFELVCGERRLRASEVLGELIPKVPAVVEEMDDLSVLQLQLVENMQRESLTPMEEANAFKRLKEMGQSQESIAEKIGKSPMYVSHRITLCRLEGSAVADALEKGAITFTHARALARIPSVTLRDELLQKVLHPPDGSSAPWSQESLEAHIKLDYMIDLRTARFDTTDATLVPVEYEEVPDGVPATRLFGGECGDCPLRIQATGKGNPSLCTNPQCFQMKEIAAHERWREIVSSPPSREATAGQISTLSHGENAEIWNESGRALAFHSPYVELDDPPSNQELRGDIFMQQDHVDDWRELIRDQAVPIVLGRDVAGKVHELVRHDLAKKAAHLNGHKIFRDSEREQRTDRERSSTAPAQVQSADERSETETLETKRQREEAARIKAAEIEAIVAAAEGKECRGQFRLPKAFYQQLLFTLLSVGESFESVGEAFNISRAVMERRGLAFEEASLTGLTIGQQFGLAVEMLVALEQEGKESWASVFGVDLKATRRKAEKKAKKESSSAKATADLGKAA